MYVQTIKKARMKNNGHKLLHVIWLQALVSTSLFLFCCFNELAKSDWTLHNEEQADQYYFVPRLIHHTLYNILFSKDNQYSQCIIVHYLPRIDFNSGPEFPDRRLKVSGKKWCDNIIVVQSTSRWDLPVCYLLWSSYFYHNLFYLYENKKILG